MIELAPRKRRNVRGKSGEKARGSFCTPKPVAEAIGPFDLDPFSNPYSHIIATRACMLEDGGDGFGGGRKGVGAYKVGGRFPLYGEATADTTTFIQPDYSFVLRALEHYEHTRFVALLRLDPRVTWFRRLFQRVEAIRVFWDIQFDPPQGVQVDGKGTNSFPHALFYKCADDVTDAVLRMTFGWRKARRHG